MRARRPLRSRDLLVAAGLRATQQRLTLVELLFGRGGRHVSAESLHEELSRSGARGSLSCVYRSLRGFSKIRLLKRVPIYGSTAWFDTQVDHHRHYYAVDEDLLLNVPAGRIALADLPEPRTATSLLAPTCFSASDASERIRKQCDNPHIQLERTTRCFSHPPRSERVS